MRYGKSMSEALAEMREGFSPKEIKMAIGIASDKRYAGGNYTGAVNAIEKIKKGLSKHKQVAAVLKRQNEDIQESGHDDVASAKNQVKVAMSALQKMETELGKLKDEDSLPTWWTNKVAVSVDKLDGMADYLDTQVEEVELDEMKEPFVVVDTADGNKVVGSASSEKGAKEIITTAQLPPMKIKDKKTLKIVKVKKKQMIGHPIKEETELDEKFKVGDKVKVKKGSMKSPSQRHYEKTVGTIVKDYGDDDFKVNFGGNDNLSIEGELLVKEEIELDEAKYKYDGKVVKISKKDFAKVSKDYKNTTKGKERMMILDPKTQASISVPVQFEEVELDEMKMNDPKLNKIFDKLKKGSKVKLKTSSTISQGKDYVEYIVKSKNTVNKGRVEKITLATVGNEKAVKKFLYKRDGQVTFAIGDMGASIDDIKESTNEVPENMAAYLAAITKQLGEK